MADRFLSYKRNRYKNTDIIRWKKRRW